MFGSCASLKFLMTSDETLIIIIQKIQYRIGNPELLFFDPFEISNGPLKPLKESSTFEAPNSPSNLQPHDNQLLILSPSLDSCYCCSKNTGIRQDNADIMRLILPTTSAALLLSCVSNLFLLPSSSLAFQPNKQATKTASSVTPTSLFLADEIKEYRRGLNKIDNKDSQKKASASVHCITTDSTYSGGTRVIGRTKHNVQNEKQNR